MKTNKGFTLVELLVVIAIIVTLASIVLVGIQSATKRAKNARIIADMSQLRSQIEIEKENHTGIYSFLDSGNTGADIYQASTEIKTLIDDIGKQRGVINADNDDYEGYMVAQVNTSGDGMTWCVQTTLVQTGTDPEYYCIDSTGRAGTTKNGPTHATAPSCSDTVNSCAGL